MACIITRAISSKKEKKFNHRRTRILSVIDNEIKKNSRGKSSVGQNRYTVGKQGENSRENRFFESTSSFYQPGKRRGNGRISKPAESRKVEARLPDVDEHWTHTRARSERKINDVSYFRVRLPRTRNGRIFQPEPRM